VGDIWVDSEWNEKRWVSIVESIINRNPDVIILYEVNARNIDIFDRLTSYGYISHTPYSVFGKPSVDSSTGSKISNYPNVSFGYSSSQKRETLLQIHTEERSSWEVIYSKFVVLNICYIPISTREYLSCIKCSINNGERTGTSASYSTVNIYATKWNPLDREALNNLIERTEEHIDCRIPSIISISTDAFGSYISPCRGMTDVWYELGSPRESKVTLNQDVCFYIPPSNSRADHIWVCNIKPRFLTPFPNELEAEHVGLHMECILDPITSRKGIRIPGIHFLPSKTECDVFTVRQVRSPSLELDIAQKYGKSRSLIEIETSNRHIETLANLKEPEPIRKVKNDKSGLKKQSIIFESKISVEQPGSSSGTFNGLLSSLSKFNPNNVRKQEIVSNEVGSESVTNQPKTTVITEKVEISPQNLMHAHTIHRIRSERSWQSPFPAEIQEDPVKIKKHYSTSYNILNRLLTRRQHRDSIDSSNPRRDSMDLRRYDSRRDSMELQREKVLTQIEHSESKDNATKRVITRDESEKDNDNPTAGSKLCFDLKKKRLKRLKKDVCLIL
ncbi:Hypothetical protein HVR_LOCUS603, partial [uncultured virus]